MKMTDFDKYDADNGADNGLEAYFEAGRAAEVLPSADLLGRIMADAQTQMPQVDTPVRQPGFFASVLEAIGGWPTLAGMATAGVVGVWIGFSQPAGLDQLAEQIWGGEQTGYLVDLAPAFAPEFAPEFNDEFEEG